MHHPLSYTERRMGERGVSVLSPNSSAVDTTSIYMVHFIASLNARRRVRFRPRAIGRDHPAELPP